MKEKSKLWAYVTSFAVALIISLISAMAWDIFAQTELLSIIRILSDCFFLPGVLLVGVSLIGWVGSKGTFDIFGFSLRGLFNLFKRESYHKQETFYDYRTRKDENRKPFNLPRFMVGLVFFVLGVIFTVIYLLIK